MIIFMEFICGYLDVHESLSFSIQTIFLAFAAVVIYNVWVVI